MKKFLLSLLEPLDRILWNWMCINGFILFARRGGPPGKNFKGATRGDSQGKFNPIGAALNVVGSVTNAITNAANSITAGLSQSFDFDFEREEEQDPILYYPSTLTDNPNRPQIKFSCIERAPGADVATSDDISELFFPCPANIAFADQGNYNVLDLGVLAAGIISEDSSAGQLSIDAALGGGVNVLREAGLQKGIDAVLFANKRVANPFQNTQFMGNNIRNFTFNFKLIAKTQQDADMINRIHRKFRAKSYADKSRDSSAAFLKYPPIWEIDFIHGHDDTGFRKNPYMPEINLCYLTTVNTTFNTTAAAWAPTGAPIEVDISLTFQETRANQRGDVLGLAAADYAGMASARQYDRTTGQATNLYAVGSGDLPSKEERNDSSDLNEVMEGYKENSGIHLNYSDIRLKEDIVEVGVSPSGIKIYEFKYINGIDKYQGVMAQDLLEIDSKHPAVSTDDDGYYTVDYNLIDTNMRKII